MNDESVQDLIDRLDSLGVIEKHPDGIRHFMLQACIELSPLLTPQYGALVDMGRQHLAGRLSRVEIREAQALAEKERDAESGVSPEVKAAFAAIRYVLDDTNRVGSEPFHALWMFVDVAERAGLAEDWMKEFLDRELRQ